MSFWDRRVLDQVMTQLEAANYAHYVKRLPSEYESGQEMLRVRLVNSFYVDMISMNAAWCFVLWGVEDGVTTPLSDRRPFSAGLPLGTTAKAVALKLQEQVPVLQRQVQDYVSSVPMSAALPGQQNIEQAVELSATQLAGIGVLVENNLETAGFDLQVKYLGAPDAQLSVLIHGLPPFSLMPSNGMWWIYWASFPATIARGSATSNLDSGVPVNAPPRQVALLACYFVVRTIIFLGVDEGLYPEGLGAEEQAVMLQAFRFMTESALDADEVMSAMATFMLKELEEL